MVPVDSTASLRLLVVFSHRVSTSAFRGRNRHGTPYFGSGFVKH